MNANEVLREVFEDAPVKRVAAALGLHPNTLYKWCEPDNGKASGTLNPLERFDRLQQAADDDRLVAWLCGRRNGFFVKNPAVPALRPDLPAEIRTLLRDLGQLQLDLADALAQPAAAGRTRQLRRDAEKLKSHLERLVREFERGEFRRRPAA